MYRQIMSYITGRDKVRNLAVGVTGNILQSSRAVRFFIQPLNRHNREYLVYRPGIRQRLEQWEVTEIFIRKQLGQSSEFVRRMFQAFGNLINLTCDRPVQAFNLCTSFQVDNSVTEQIQRFLTNLLRIMPCLQHFILIQRIPNAI